MKKMNAEKARKKYFEYYVDFEHILKMILQKNNVDTKKLSLSHLIKELTLLKNFQTYTIKVKELWNQLDCRNWLAHKYRENIVNDPLLLKFQNIKKLNMVLSKILKRK